jgi:signal transduction histidine kinase
MYHLALFRLAKTLPSTLHFGIYCLFTFGYCMTSKTSLWGASLFLPPLPPLLGEYLPLFCFVAWGPFLNRFYLSLYPEEFHKITRHISDARLAGYVLLLLFAAPVRSSQYILLAMVTGMGLGIYYLQRLIVCVRRGRDGAWLMLAGTTVFLISAISDALSHARVINVAYLIEPGMFFFVVTQALTLARRFTLAFEAVETLSDELEQKKRLPAGRNRGTQQAGTEVVHISEEERRRISHELHDGLCQKLTGARLRAAILNRRLADTGDGAAMADLRELLDASADDAYRTSRGLWPVEHDPRPPGLRWTTSPNASPRTRASPCASSASSAAGSAPTPT